jgi:hypothetical protein
MGCTYEVVRVDRFGTQHLVGRFEDCTHPYEALMRAGCDMLVRDVETGDWCWDRTWLAREAALTNHARELQGDEKY